MKPIEPEEEDSANTLRRNLLPLAKRVAAGIGIFWLVLTGIIGLVWQEDAGTVGDTFGAVNALFSGLALAGVVIAILLQSEDLRAQEKAMALQTTEMKDTTEALDAQTKLLEAQVSHATVQEFDYRFFEIIRTARSVWEALNYVPAGANQPVAGARGLRCLCHDIPSRVQPNFNAQKYSNSFGPIAKENSGEYEPATQLMTLAVEMAGKSQNPVFYLAVWKAAFSHQEKWLWGHVQFFAQSGIPAHLVQMTEEHALLKGIESPLSMTVELGLKPTAFGKSESAAT